MARLFHTGHWCAVGLGFVPMTGDESGRSTFKWDEGDEELELRGKEQRRFSAWKIFLPGFVVLAGAVVAGILFEATDTLVLVVMALASAWQLLLSHMYAVRRTEIEYLWPLEKHLRLGATTGATYRERARYETVDLDGLTVNIHEIREVQLRRVVEASETEQLEAFLVFDDRVILVERSADHESIQQYAQQLRERFGVEGEPGKPQPISSAPTQGPDLRVFLLPLGAGGAVAAAIHYLPLLFGRTVVLPTIAVAVAVGCVPVFWLYRAKLRRASHRWVQEEFGLDPRRATREGRITQP